MTVTPIDLFSSFIHLDDRRVRAEPPSFDAERDGWQLMTFHVETDTDLHADHWEVHPDAEELVSCLTGGIRLVLRPEQPGHEEEEIALTPGTAAIVPRGRWHRLALDAPGAIMSVTLPRGSRLEKRSVGQRALSGGPGRTPSAGPAPGNP
ncbi:cupin [Streptomyces platensis]|uniref:cupin n=1 Tax=Streptomyces platensis TaxID=58346 RepID=UPI002E121E94